MPGKRLLARPTRENRRVSGDLGGQPLAFFAAGKHECRGDLEPLRGVCCAPRQPGQQFPQALELKSQLRLRLKEPRRCKRGVIGDDLGGRIGRALELTLVIARQGPKIGRQRLRGKLFLQRFANSERTG